MYENIKNTIEDHINEKMLIRIERKNVTDDEAIVGFPIKLSDDFLLMTNIFDFYDDGYTIVKTSDISDAYSKESDEFYEMVCINENLLKRVDECPISSVKSMKDILTELSKQNFFIVVECEKSEDDFFIGKIKITGENKVVMQSFDALGKWHDENDIIKYEDITKITFLDRYSKMYFKYMK